MIMYAENTFDHRTKESINMFFKNIKRWDVIKMFNKDIPRSSRIREKTIHVSVRFTYYFTKSVTDVSTEQGYSLEVVCHLGRKESCDRRSYESVKYAYTYDDQIGFPILIPRRV